MESEKLEDIEQLLRRMREENANYRKTQGTLLEEPTDSHDEDFPLPSRYKSKENLSDTDSPCRGEAQDTPPRNDYETRLNEVRKRKNKLGPPVKVSKEPGITKRPVTAQPRPLGARVPKQVPVFPVAPLSKRKNDPVSLYQQRQNDWKAALFLRSNGHLKQGRKLNIPVPKKPFQARRVKPMFVKNEYQPPHEKRRDEVRNETRQKLTSK